MCALKRKRANLISMEAATYDQTPMSEEKQVTGVPTVLFVNKEGKITEAQEPRNREIMTNAISQGVTDVDASVAGPVVFPTTTATTTPSVSVSSTSEPLPGTEMPAGTEIRQNPLDVLPAQPVPTGGVQYGGSPWAAFLQAAAQAAPAAVLAGAYAVSTAHRRRTVRSSGLPAPYGRRRSHSRRHR